MKRLVTMAVAAMCAAQVLAMPTKAELTQAEPMVKDLMLSAMTAFQDAAKKDRPAAAVKVGDASLAFVKEAKTEAAQFLLLKGAVGFYARGGEYDKAADALVDLQNKVKDVPPAVILDLADKATEKVKEDKAARLYAIYRKSKVQVKAGNQAPKLAEKLQKVNSDVIRRQYAEALAISGNWKAAFKEFARIGDAELQNIVADEVAGKAKNEKTAAFWWSYKPSLKDADDFFKVHAVAFYQKALAAGEIAGLKKNIAEQRVADFEPAAKPAEAKASAGDSGTAAYATPAAGSGKAWAEKGTTATLTLPNGEKLEFVKCPAGNMQFIRFLVKQNGETTKSKISRAFWIMTRPLSACNIKGYPQHEACNPKDDGKPSTYAKLQIDACDGIVAALTDDIGDSLPKGYILRLPSLAEWDYAVQANSRNPNDPYSTVPGALDGWGSEIMPENALGTTPKNKWGLHELRKEEWLLDKTSNETTHFQGYFIKDLPEWGKDPFLWTEGSGSRFWRQPGSPNRIGTQKVYPVRPAVLRLVVGPDLVAEWKARRAMDKK